MLPIVVFIGGAAVVGSLPSWLPRAILALRMRIFTRINGGEGLPIPGPLVDNSLFRQVYANAAANGRSRGAALSDLFWYWLSPGPQMHQEHIEPGDRYEEIARITKRLLAIPKHSAEELTARCLAHALDDVGPDGVTVVRLRDLMMPVWAQFYYELVFGETCSASARRLIVENANDVVTALKCCSLRHMDRRDRLTRFLITKLQDGALEGQFPGWLSIEERALYLQGVFFNTAIVQMSEAMAHLCMAIAQNQPVQRTLAERPGDDGYWDRVIAETLRLYPLFGISHRITSADIAVDEQTTIRKGSVLCFNHPEYHRSGFDHPDRFDPDRWETLSARDANYIPFGVTGNRPCPAHTLAHITMRAAGKGIVRRFSLFTSAEHTRSIPNRGPCLLVPRTQRARPPAARLLLMRLQDRWEDVWRSIVQLVLGSYMVWDAHRLRLCERHFES